MPSPRDSLNELSAELERVLELPPFQRIAGIPALLALQLALNRALVQSIERIERERASREEIAS